MQIDKEIDVLEREQTEEPPLYAVVYHNDPYTPFDFVVITLTEILHKSEEEAVHIARIAENNNRSVAGVYVYEYAENYVNSILVRAKKYQYPLLVTIEPESSN